MYFIAQILVNIQIFPLVGGNSSLTRPAYKYTFLGLVKLYNNAYIIYESNLVVLYLGIIMVWTTQNVGPDLDPTVCHSDIVIAKKVSRRHHGIA